MKWYEQSLVSGARLLSVQMNQTPVLYAGSRVYPGPGFYLKFYGSNLDRKIGNVVVLKEYHYIVTVLLLVVGSLCGILFCHLPV